MHQPVRPIDTDRRSEERHPIRLECQLTFTDRSAYAQTVDLSFNGARIMMPLVASAYDFERLTTIHIAGVGVVRARKVWNRDREVGVEFRSPNTIRQSLARLFASQSPVGRFRTL